MQWFNNMYDSKCDLGAFSICIADIDSIPHIKIMKWIDGPHNSFAYLQIGVCKLYNQTLSFHMEQCVSIENHPQIYYIPFKCENHSISIEYMLYMDVADLEGNDARYNMGSQHKKAYELHKIDRNRYYKSLEGRQCKSYRYDWNSVCDH
eukprot:261478_1